MGICIEIEKNDDGTFTVSECEPKAEAMPGEEGGEPSGQTVKSLDEAIGVLTDLMSGETGAQAEDAMTAAQRGYGSRQVMPRQTVGRVFGDE